MYQDCAGCGRVYNDEHCSTVCPHRGIGFCIVCDCVVCVCTPQTTRDWKRSSNYASLEMEPFQGGPPPEKTSRVRLSKADIESAAEKMRDVQVKPDENGNFIGYDQRFAQK